MTGQIFASWGDQAGFLLAIGISASSAEIVHFFAYHVATHDLYNVFSYFDPTLGTLTGVNVSVSGALDAQGITFFNTSLTGTVAIQAF